MQPTKTKALLEIHLAVLFFGLAGLFGKWLTLSPLLIVFGRTSWAALTLGLALTLQRRWQRPRRAWQELLMGALLAFHWIAFFQSVQLASVAVALLTFSTFPGFVALLEPLMDGTRHRVTDLALAALVLLGVTLVIPQWTWGGQVLEGALWGVASGFSFALLALLNRQRVRQLPPLEIAALQNAAAALLLAPWAVGQVAAVLDLRSFLLLMALGVGCTALAHGLFIGSLRTLRAQLVSLIAALEPVYGILFALLLLDERPAPRTLIGGLIILAAVFLASRRPDSESAT